MNLSCSPFSQSASLRCSMTPPGAEPALLTMMSTRPSALCPCATKFLASASLVRSATMGTTLRFVSFAISAAAASSTSLRRAQIATSTPSFPSARAMPLPIPSLPPVTSAVLPSSCRSILPSHDRLRGVADRLDIVAGIEERDDAARTAFEALVTPRERADQGALIEHQLDVAAEIFGVQQALLERPIVEREHVGDDFAPGFLVRVFERAEEFRRRLAVALGELRGKVGAHVADRGVHGVVARAGIHGPPLDLLLQHPVHGVEVRAGVEAEILHQVLLRLALVVAVPA